MLKLIKTIIGRQGISFNDSTKINHYLEIYLLYGCTIERMEFPIAQRDPKFVVETLKQNIKNFERCIKFKFFDRVEETKKDKTTIGRAINASGNYYFGKKLTMSEVEMRHQRIGIYTSLTGYDEYQLGGVLHAKSCLVFPIYANDIVIDVELEQEKEKLKEDQLILKRVIK